MLLIVILTIIFCLYKINNVVSNYKETDKKIIGTVTDIKKEEDKTTLNIKGKENIVVYTKNDINIYLGDKILVYGTLKALKNNSIFNLFNYKKYMLSKNTYYSIFADKIKILKYNSNIFYKIKTILINHIEKIKYSEYLKIFILGDNKYLDKTIKESFKINGISHLFSVSGMHISLLSTIILFLLNKIKKSKINYILTSLILILFSFLTSFSPSVLRSVYLFIFLYFNKQLNLKIPTIKIIIFILCINLILNPYNIYNAGFIFSYTISIYLILFNKLINRQKRYITKTLMTSFISFLVSIPILINNYFSINLSSIINNIIFVPFISFIVFPLSLLVVIMPFLEPVFVIVIKILEFTTIFFQKFKIEMIMSKMNFFYVILYYLIITLILYKFLNKKYKYIMFIIILMVIHTNINNIRNDLYITFLDVGQGDSTLIHLPHNKNILIDTGGKIDYNLSVNIINYMKSKGIKKLDYLVLTHGDYDHMGEAINLIENYKVDNVIFNCGEFNNLEKNLIKILNKKKIRYYSCINELNINNYKLQFLNTKIYNNENDNSSVIYLNYNNYKFLFMGDAGVDKEKDILEKYNLSNINVIKVGHHGSKTSSSKEYINEISPKYSIISVGKNNRYGHPNKEVLNNLEQSKIYRTDIDGSIMFRIKNNKLKIKACSP